MSHALNSFARKFFCVRKFFWARRRGWLEIFTFFPKRHHSILYLRDLELHLHYIWIKIARLLQLCFNFLDAERKDNRVSACAATLARNFSILARNFATVQWLKRTFLGLQALKGCNFRNLSFLCIGIILRRLIIRFRLCCGFLFLDCTESQGSERFIQFLFDAGFTNPKLLLLYL